MDIIGKIKALRANGKKPKVAAFWLVFVLLIAAAVILPAQLARGVEPAITGDALDIAGQVGGGLLTRPLDTVVAILNGIMLWVVELFLKLTIFLLNFIIELAGYNAYLDSPAVNVGWVLVRDLTNMFFVAVLLVIAFGTILGLEQYEWKKLMVKFVLAAILVNFSRLICGLIIDAAQVVMATFVNGIAATAGGNLIQAFGMDRILSIARNVNPDQIDRGSFFIGLVVALTFSALLMAMMAVYMVILLARMISLWILIVLSPFAFVLSVLPQTASKAQEWWKEFGNNVISGPLAVFFIWLALVTVGAGDIHTQIAEGSTNRLDNIESIGANTVGIGDVMAWDKMAGFFIGLGMLLLGAKKTQELGVIGSSAMGGAVDFAKKTAMFAAGVTTAKFALDTGVKAAKLGAYHMPILGGQAWEERAKLVSARVQDYWYRKIGSEGGKWNPLAISARRTARRRKRLRAAEGTAKDSEALLQKEQSSGQWGNRARERKGQLAAYEKRSKERDAEGIAAAKLEQLRLPRKKDGEIYINPETGQPATLDGEAARFMVRRQRWEAEEQTSDAETRAKIFDRIAPDVERAAEESEKIKEERKPEELQVSEAKEKSLKTELTTAEETMQKKVDIEMKKDSDVIVGEAKLEELRVVMKENTDQAEKLKNDPQYIEFVKLEEGIKKAMTTQEEIDKKLGDSSVQLEESEKKKLEGEKKKQEAVVAKLTEKKTLVEAQGGEIATQIEEAEGKKRLAKNSSEDIIEDIKKKRKKYVSDFEKEEIRPGGPTLTVLRGEYETAQKDTTDKKLAWDKLVADAEDSKVQAPPGSAVAAQRERDEEVAKKLKKIEKGLFEGDLLDPKTGKPVMANGKVVKREDSNMAISYIQAKQRAATTQAKAAEVEDEMKKLSLGLDSFNNLFTAEAAAKMGEEASRAFIDGIKEQKMGDLFKKGAKELKEALEKGGASLEKLKLDNVGARVAQAQMISEYNKDITASEKREAGDNAESIFTMERYNFRTPSAAFKEWVKKQTERLQGTEREQSVIMAMGTVGQFFKMRKQGQEISTDQKAQMMAHLKHLTSNGWMDDLLGRIAKMSASKDSLTGEQRQEAEALEDVFIKQLKWDPHDNRSGADRTAQVQKLVAMGGDVKQMQAEEAALWMMENTGNSYNGANKKLATVAKANETEILDQKTDRNIIKQRAVEAGILTAQQLSDADDIFSKTRDRSKAAVEAGVNQLIAYTEQFAKPAESAEAAAEAFMKSMEKFRESFEMLADFKNLAMNTGHIDDGGHTYYDMDARMVRGNLGHKGKEFVLGEWRKLGLDQRLTKLKTHSVGQMNEDWGTIDYTDSAECGDSIRETFAGLSNQREFAKVDGRNKDHIAGMAAGESIRKDASGRTLIGDDDSAYYRGTFGYIENRDDRKKRVEDQLRGNYAAFLRNNPVALFGSLAERSGLSFDDGMKGKINVNVCGRALNSVEDLVNWVNEDPVYQFNPEFIRSSLPKASESGRQ